MKNLCFYLFTHQILPIKWKRAVWTCGCRWPGGAARGDGPLMADGANGTGVWWRWWPVKGGVDPKDQNRARKTEQGNGREIWWELGVMWRDKGLRGQWSRWLRWSPVAKTRLPLGDLAQLEQRRSRGDRTEDCSQRTVCRWGPVAVG